MGTEIFDILANPLELIGDPDLVIRGRFDPFFLPFFRNLSHNRLSQKFTKKLQTQAKSISPKLCEQKIF